MNNPIKQIITNYVQNERTLVQQLHFKADHGSTIGGFREDIWKSMFEQIIPKKFVIEQSVFIIDSNGRISKEVDLAIFDEMYTPYIFRYGRLKFLPIEAVAVVIECKSTSIDQNNLTAWVKAIAQLQTSRMSYTRMYPGVVADTPETEKAGVKLTQTATRPLRILCCLTENFKNSTFLHEVNKQEIQETLFDFVIRALDSELHIETDTEKADLQAWYRALNHADPTVAEDKIRPGEQVAGVVLDNYKVENKDKEGICVPVSLLTLNLQLNQLLMLINNPILFPHRAYAEMFDRIGKGEQG